MFWHISQSKNSALRGSGLFYNISSSQLDQSRVAPRPLNRLCSRSLSSSRNGNLGYFYSSGASIAGSLSAHPSSQALAVPVALGAVVQSLRGSAAQVADVQEGPAQVLAPHGVDHGVHGGVEQTQHAAKGKNSLDEVVDLSEEVINHDGQERAPADDEGHQDQNEGFSQAEVHPSLLGPHRLNLSALGRVDNHTPLGAAAQHADGVVVGLPEDEHVGVDDEQEQDAGHPDPEHQVLLIDQREDVRADRVEALAVPAQQRQQRHDDGDGPHHAEGDDRFSFCHDAFVRHGPVDGDVAVDGGEEQTSHRGREGGNDAGQFKEENIRAVLPVEDVEVQEAVDKNDAPYQIGHSQTADEVVGGPRSKRLRVQDHTQHH